ncbi:uncharacterized protein LOC121645114 isoform X2 [Melanotaenia boesemani]|uniref:uncharacterized protein LOC121645114 isoform X2 n=1 Tax=Melanotaenia boesemani TaxID=1250792 RepID=UPI001C04779E|nr:uncharacterized protein LOC121645114 isoform X2 [Melanotaenia boesemani]
MSSVQHLREFISERLTAAAEEIFTEFEKTIVQYEEEIDRQRRLLDITWNPQIKLIRTDVPQQHDCREKEVVSDQQLFKQETDVGLDQEGEPLVLRVQTDLVVQCKSEPEEPLTGLEKTCIQYEEEAHRPQIQLHSTDNIMLIKAKINKEQKYVKISKPSLEEFLSSAFVKFSIVPPVRESVRVYDETGTEVDADVFEEVVQQPSAGVFTITCDRASQGGTQGAASTSPVPEVMTNPLAELSRCNSKDTIIQDEDYSPPCKQPKIKWMEIPARNLVEFALTKKPGGEQIIKEYVRTKGLTDSSRRKLVKILTAHMAGIHGTAPPRRVREMYAQGIVEMFPSLRDPYSKNGYEHFYDGESGSGYLAWRLKTIQRKDKSSEGRGSSCQLTGGGPTARRDASLSPEVTLSQEQCKEAITFMKHSSDEATIKHKMKMTFGYRRKMVLDKEKSSDVLTEFPRFKDVKGLIEQDFILEFGEDIASKFLERWPAIFRQKIIQQSKTLISSSDLQELICCAEGASNNEGFEETLALAGTGI